jgi:hypothetical protein
MNPILRWQGRSSPRTDTHWDLSVRQGLPCQSQRDTTSSLQGLWSWLWDCMYFEDRRSRPAGLPVPYTRRLRT